MVLIVAAIIPAVRMGLAVLLVLVLPGYAVTMALFRRGALDLPARLLLSLGTSLVIVILGGLALNLTPWGLQLGSWFALLTSVTLTAGATAARRDRKGLQSLFSHGRSSAKLPLTPRQGLLLGLGALLLVGSVWVAGVGADRVRGNGFTQLWVLPVQAGQRDVIRLGIRNKQSFMMDYRLQLRVRGRPFHTWRTIILPPGGTWQQTVRLPPKRSPAESERVMALLYYPPNARRVYHQVFMRR